MQLGIQAQAQTVNVTEEAGLIQTENANLATTFDTNELQNVPVGGNDMSAYAFTAPGVTVGTGQGYGNFTAFGLPGVSNAFTLNGLDYMDPYLNLNNSGASNLTLGSNEVQEAAVVLNGYTGQYGRQAGAQVNYVTKSGTNQFHGNAAFQYNDAVMNGNDWFNNANQTPRPFSISRQWYDSFGGPIKKNKLFFFADNEGIRFVLPSGGPVYIPTTQFANNVLANLQATNPAALSLYQNAFNLWNNSSGASRAIPVTAALDPQLGCGDYAGTGGFGVTQPCARTFQSTVNNLNTEWLLNSRVDYNVTNSDRLFFRFAVDKGLQATGTDAINPAFNANSVQPQYSGQIGYTKSIGSTMVNQLNLSALYYVALFGPTNFQAAVSTFPTTWCFNDGLYNNVGSIACGMGGADYNYPSGRKVRTWQLVDDFSKVKGSHDLKTGINVRRAFVSTYATLQETSGQLIFNSMTDFVNGSLGNGSTYAQNFTNDGAELLSMYSLGFYVQDEWRARRNLTLTLTMRFDRNSNINCYSNCFNETLAPFGQFAHSATTPYNQTIHTGLGSAFPSVEGIVPEPRIGIAYNIARNTVLRGGFGIFSDLYQGLIADRFITNAPAVTSFTTSSGLVATGNPNSIFAIVNNSNAAFQSGFANGATLSQLQSAVAGFAKPNFNTIANEVHNPKFYEWNVELQQALGNNYMLSVNYVGNHGWDIFNQSIWPNAYTKAGFTMPGLSASVPDARFGEIRELNNANWSNYDGLVASFRWRMGTQFTGQFSYTWSHALDTCSNECLEPFQDTAAVIGERYQDNPLGAKFNYSNADYDTRHSVSARYAYTVPTTYFHNSLLKNVVGGWTLAGTVLFHSGYPFSVIDSSVRSTQLNNVTGLANQHILADYLGTGSVTCSTPNVPCLTPSEFAKPAAQHDLGNVPRNFFRGPGYFDTDLNVNKAFTYKERYKLVVGAYMYNLFNHANFDLPFQNVATGQFGQILETVSPPTSAYGTFVGSSVSGRVIQSIVKFQF
ncbi:MAG: carboxypeptidase regulatory-like domain-containing protein [Acidobacteriia bacterium]|nr:carboxypeptidase regulatory-like domain-containing protein [Terriglobia bacterium]